MPVISKLSQNPKKNKPLPTGSILSEAIDLTDLDEIYIKMGLYGVNRVGKTTLVGTFPKPLLIVSFEPSRSGGALSLRGREGKLLRLTESKKALQLCQELREKNPFKTVAIEGATSLQMLILTEIMGLDEVPEQLAFQFATDNDYRERSEATRKVIAQFLDLNCHVVVTAKERDHRPRNDGTRKSKMLRKADEDSYFAADVGGATASWMYDAFDYIGRLCIDKETKKVTRKVKVGKEIKLKTEEVETGRTVRRLYTLANPNFMAGFRSCNPEKIPEYIEEPTFDKIFEIIKGGKEN